MSSGWNLRIAASNAASIRIFLDKGDFPCRQNFLASNESHSGKYAPEGARSTKGTGRFTLSALSNARMLQQGFHATRIRAMAEVPSFMA